MPPGSYALKLSGNPGLYFLRNKDFIVPAQNASDAEGFYPVRGVKTVAGDLGLSEIFQPQGMFAASGVFKGIAGQSQLAVDKCC